MSSCFKPGIHKIKAFFYNKYYNVPIHVNEPLNGQQLNDFNGVNSLNEINKPYVILSPDNKEKKSTNSINDLIDFFSEPANHTCADTLSPSKCNVTTPDTILSL